MANTATKYGNLGKHFADGDIDYLNNTIKIIFLKSSYVPNFDTDETITDLDLASNEVTGVVYTAGGETLGLKTAVYDAGADYTLFGAGTITLNNETIASIKYMVIADTSSSYLISCITLDPAVSVTTQILTVEFTNGTFSM